MDDAPSSSHIAPTGTAAPFRRVAAVALGLFATIGSTYFVPALSHLRPWTSGDDYVPFWNIVGREFRGEGKILAAEAKEQERLLALSEKNAAALKAPPPKLVVPPPEQAVFPPYNPQEPVQKPEWGIEPPEALDAYFRKLTLVDLGVQGAIARAGHWGDSVLGIDGITSKIRGRLQARFGDAGHGFHLISRYNPSYRQEGILFEGGGDWNRCLVAFECSKKDHRYGYGGLTATSGGGAVGRWGTTKEGFGSSATRFELWFAHQEAGGKFKLTIDGERVEEISTRGEHLKDGWYEARVKPGQHQFILETAGGGSVRAYGIVMENDGPGVVWDGMAHISGSTRGIRTQDAEHIKSQIRHRDVDLIVFMYGGNDMERGYVDLSESMQPYYDEYAEAIQKYRAGKPALSCLVMSLTDHGKREENGAITSRAYAGVLSRAQRKIAADNGCGFFDTYQATGGPGTAARWFRARPQLLSPDLGHPSPFGHDLVASLVTQALLYGYEDYRQRMVGKPLEELAAPAAKPAAQPDPAPTNQPPAQQPASDL